MKIAVNGITLFYAKSGVGTPLLLLHGNGEDHHIFDALEAGLRAHFTVYAVDSRCHGESEKTDTLTYADMTQDIKALIGALGRGAVDIVGFSDGAIVALMLAIEAPACVRRMALLGVNLSPADFTEESLAALKAEYAETGDPLVRLMLEEPSLALSDVAGVQTPTLLVAAEHDLFRAELFSELKCAMPHAKLLVKQGHTHDSYIIGSDLLYPDLLEFFSE